MKDVNIYIYTEYSGSLKSGTGKYHVILETMITVDGEEVPWTTPDIDILEDVTRNRLELIALDKALSHMTKPSRITVYTSSDFITGAFAQDWPEKWLQNEISRKKINQLSMRTFGRVLWSRLKSMMLHLCNQHIQSTQKRRLRS